MKSDKVKDCWECPDNIVCHCYGLDPEREITLEDEKQMVKNGFPSWCPLENVNEGGNYR